MAQPEFMTCKQLAEFLRERGYPVSLATFHKLGAPSRGEGPPIAKWWNKRPLYTPDDGLAWALSRTRDPEARTAA